MSANLQDIVAAASAAGSPEVPIEKRVRLAYDRARGRTDAPAALLDGEFAVLGRRLHQLASPQYGRVSDVETAERAKLLAEAEKSFNRWADMPAGEFTSALYQLRNPPVPSQPPEHVARSVIDGLVARGIRIELWHKTFRASPAGKLDLNDKSALQSLKAHILAELTHRADAWTPE